MLQLVESLFFESLQLFQHQRPRLFQSVFDGVVVPVRAFVVLGEVRIDEGDARFFKDFYRGRRAGVSRRMPVVVGGHDEFFFRPEAADVFYDGQ